MFAFLGIGLKNTLKKPIMEELNLSEMTISIKSIVVTLFGIFNETYYSSNSLSQFTELLKKN